MLIRKLPCWAVTEARTVEILSVGRLDPVKGAALLISAVANLLSQGRPVHLTLVGGGPMAAELRAIADRLGIGTAIDFPGPIGQDELPTYYASADIFCMASFAEGVPVVLMEAMASGLPVVTTRIAGIPELVEDGRTGLLVSPGRSDLLVDALGRLIDDEVLRRTLGEAARDRVEAEFDAEACGREVARHLAALQGFDLVAT